MARPREFEEEKVLEAAMDKFWRLGFKGTSAQDLVEATGLGRGSLYNAFSNKESLFERALQHYRKRSRQSADVLERPGPVQDRIRELLLGVVDSDLNDPDRRGCLSTNTAIEQAGRDPRVADLVRQNFQVVTMALERAIRRAQEIGEVPADKDAAALAVFVLNTMQGLRVLGKTTPKSERQKLVSTIELTLQLLR